MITKHTKIIGIIALPTFIVSVVGYGVLSYVILEREAELNEQQQRSVNAQAHVQELVLLKRTAEESNAERAQLESYVLRDEAVIDFLSLIETIGREQGTVLTTQSLDVTAREGQFEELRIEIGISGTYENIVRALRILETLPYQTHLSSLDFSRGSAGDGTVWSAKTTLFVTKFRAE